MFLIAFLFFKVLFTPFISETLASDYLAGAAILGAALVQQGYLFGVA